MRMHLGRLVQFIKRSISSAPPTRAVGVDTLTEAQLSRIGDELLKRLFGADGSANRFVDHAAHPIDNPLARLLRESSHALWNTKVLGSEIARLLYERDAEQPDARSPPDPVAIGLTSKLCHQVDIESPWLRHWCDRLCMKPLYHRKVWEDCFVLQALWEHGMLRDGCRGLGFAVGTEPLPAFLCGHGIDILATDLDAADARASGWSSTNQHAAHKDALFKPSLVSREAFDRLCTFQPLDMNHIPRNLRGSFDFCWSICSFEHVGSIEKGLRFVENSVDCLLPGGIAVHTTEFNLYDDGPTIDDWPTVLFQRQHIEALRDRLAAKGHRMLEPSFDPGSGVLDRFVDVPPFEHQPRSTLHYEHTPHLKLSVDGFPVTSIGLIILAAGR